MIISINNATDNYILNYEIAKDLIAFIIDQENIIVNEISLILANQESVRKLKLEYFNEDVYTDTITFNVNDPDEPLEGEIYLSADTIYQNAMKLRISYNQEFANVIAHSVLHLIGYDDSTQEEKNEMFELQKKYLKKFNYQEIIFRVE